MSRRQDLRRESPRPQGLRGSREIRIGTQRPHEGAPAALRTVEADRAAGAVGRVGVEGTLVAVAAQVTVGACSMHTTDWSGGLRREPRRLREGARRVASRSQHAPFIDESPMAMQPV